MRARTEMVLRGINLATLIMLGIGGAYLADCRGNRWNRPNQCWEAAMGWFIGGGLTRVGMDEASRPPPGTIRKGEAGILPHRRRRPPPDNPRQQ